MIFFLFISGLFVGSFLNVLVDRLSSEENINGRSYCDHCKRQLGLVELIPVISFIFQKGYSKCCNKKLSIWYPVVEFLTGIAFILPFVISSHTSYFISQLQGQYHHLINPYLFWIYLAIYLLLISCSIVTIVADVKYHIIPDEMTVLTGLAALPILFINHSLFSLSLHTPLLAAFIVMAPILLLHIATKGKGMGFGDVKYAFVMGLWLGIRDGLLAMYLAFILGGIVGIIYLLRGKKQMKSAIAFGPFLVVGFLAMLFYQRSMYEVVKMIFHLV